MFLTCPVVVVLVLVVVVILSTAAFDLVDVRFNSNLRIPCHGVDEITIGGRS